MSRLTPSEARDILARTHSGGRDFHALPSAEVEALIDEADAYGYQRPRNANGSRARYWHAYLTRVAERRDA